MKHSEETKQKMRDAAKRTMPQRLINLSKGHGWNTGLTKETSEGVRRISEAKKGIKHTAEHRRKNSLAHIGLLAGDKHPMWKGGKKNHLGYVMIKRRDHHRANSEGYVLEHIAVWEETHNKILPKNMCIHHLNGIKNDNRPENLVDILKGAHSNLAEPFKEKIKELEVKITELEQIINGYPERIKEMPSKIL